MSDLEVMANPRPAGRVPLALVWAGALFLVITVTLGVDLVDDLFNGGVGRLHVVGESVAFALAIVGAVGTTMQIRKILARTEELSRDVLRVQAELDRWRAEAKPALGGLRVAIE